MDNEQKEQLNACIENYDIIQLCQKHDIPCPDIKTTETKEIIWIFSSPNFKYDSIDIELPENVCNHFIKFDKNKNFVAINSSDILIDFLIDHASFPSWICLARSAQPHISKNMIIFYMHCCQKNCQTKFRIHVTKSSLSGKIFANLSNWTTNPCTHFALLNGGIMTSTAQKKYGKLFPSQEKIINAFELKQNNIKRYIYRNFTVCL